LETKFTCNCPNDRYGDYCERIDICGGINSPNPCLNGGGCVELTGDVYKCECINNWYGKNCQMRSPCSFINCFNGGQCNILKDDKAVCKCQSKNFY
jgi:hypothetical protein